MRRQELNTSSADNTPMLHEAVSCGIWAALECRFLSMLDRKWPGGYLMGIFNMNLFGISLRILPIYSGPSSLAGMDYIPHYTFDPRIARNF